MHWRLMFLHCAALPSQPASFVGLCHSLICCIVSSQVVWLSLRNYHSNRLSQVMVSSEFRKSSTAPAVLCWVRRALLPSSLGSGSVVLNKGSRLWLFLTILAGEVHSPVSLHVPSERSPKYLSRHDWGCWLQWPSTVCAVRTPELTLFLPSTALC